jgi:repressor LexA
MENNNLDNREFKGLFFIKDSIVYKGKTPSLRDIAEHLGFKSPRSSALLIERLEEKGYIQRTSKGGLRLLKDIDGKAQTDRTINIPLVGSAPCGLPFLAEENIEAMISVSQRLAKPGAQYFLLRAVGNSMNKAGIKDRDLVLVRQQPVANPGERIVAIIGDEATIKIYQRKGDKVVLMPQSTDPRHKPIILTDDFMIQGVIVDTISNPF